MTETKNEKFLGTYFSPDMVLRLARWADILSWVVVVVYAVDLLAAIGTFILTLIRGYWGGGFTDLLNNIIFIVERPFRGVVYFIALQAIGKALLILLDMEENTRRLARK
jgi:hypothetical protein